MPSIPRDWESTSSSGAGFALSSVRFTEGIRRL